PSRAGRSLIKVLTAGQPLGNAGEGIWLARAHAYWNRSLVDGSTTVGAQAVDSNWSAATVAWSTAPAFNPAAAPATETVTYASANPQPRWCHWTIPVCHEIAAGLPLSIGLAATNESFGGPN